MLAGYRALQCFALPGPGLHCIDSSSIQYILFFGVRAQVSLTFVHALIDFTKTGGGAIANKYD